MLLHFFVILWPLFIQLVNEMKNLVFVFVALLGLVALVSCNDGETYAEQRDRENSAIRRYISENNISVLTESEFRDNGYKTDTARREFVLMQSSGVYMQIVRKGCGDPIKDGETTTVLCRFTERNLLTDSIQLTNDILSFVSIPEKMSVTNTNGTFTASFDPNSSLMYTFYSTASVPTGWLVPFNYINIGRQTEPDDEIAKVNLIVPSTQGHQYASSGVYPCLYTITYERGR